MNVVFLDVDGVLLNDKEGGAKYVTCTKLDAIYLKLREHGYAANMTGNKSCIDVFEPINNYTICQIYFLSSQKTTIAVSSKEKNLIIESNISVDKICEDIIDIYSSYIEKQMNSIAADLREYKYDYPEEYKEACNVWNAYLDDIYVKKINIEPEKILADYREERE